MKIDSKVFAENLISRADVFDEYYLVFGDNLIKEYSKWEPNWIIKSLLTTNSEFI